MVVQLDFYWQSKFNKVCGFDLFAALHRDWRPWDVEERCTTWSWKWERWRQSAASLRADRGHNSPHHSRCKLSAQRHWNQWKQQSHSLTQTVQADCRVSVQSTQHSPGWTKIQVILTSTWSPVGGSGPVYFLLVFWFYISCSKASDWNWNWRESETTTFNHRRVV